MYIGIVDCESGEIICVCPSELDAHHRIVEAFDNVHDNFDNGRLYVDRNRIPVARIKPMTAKEFQLWLN